MKENKLVDLSMDFAIKIIKLCETIKGHYSLVNQLERSATSIGANIHEANYAHGKPDFIAKYEGRSGNGQILHLIRQCIRDFESENGKIPFESDDKEAQD